VQCFNPFLVAPVDLIYPGLPGYPSTVPETLLYQVIGSSTFHDLATGNELVLIGGETIDPLLTLPHSSDPYLGQV
jgi:hypothetical protein